MAASALGTAISDMFTGLLEGESNKQKIQEQAERTQALHWAMEKERTFLPFEAQKMQLGVESEKQAREKGALDIAGSREALANLPTQRAYEAAREGRAASKEGREAGKYGMEEVEAERSTEAYKRQQEALKDLPRYLEQGQKGTLAWVLKYGDVVKNPTVAKMADAWIKQNYPSPLDTARTKAAEASAAASEARGEYYKGMKGRAPLSAADKEVLRQDRENLKSYMGELQKIESALGRGDKPMQEPGKPWTKDTVAAEKKKVFAAQKALRAKLAQEELPPEPPKTADEYWNKKFGSENMEEEEEEP